MNNDINEPLLDQNEPADIPEPADESVQPVEEDGEQTPAEDTVEQTTVEDDGEQVGQPEESTSSLNYEEIYTNVTEPVDKSGKPIFKQPVKFIEAKDLYKKNVVVTDANNNVVKAGIYNFVDGNGQPTKVAITVNVNETNQPVMFNDTYTFIECELNAAGNPYIPSMSKGTRMFLIVFGIITLCLTIAIVAYWMWYLQDHKKRMEEADKVTLERSNKANDDFRNSFVTEDIRSTEEERNRLAEEQANILAKQEELQASNDAADAAIKKAKAEAAELKAQAEALKKKRAEQKAAQAAAAESFEPNDPNMRTETFTADYVYNTNYKSMLMNQLW